MPVLRAGYAALALQLQEAADTSDLSNSDVLNRLRDGLADAYRGTGHWAYYIDHFGDAESGDLIYSCDGDTFRCPYEISAGEGSAAKCTIDTDKAEDVVPRTVYEVEEDEDGHIAAMESMRSDGLYTEIPLYERFISKGERDAADASDFAGKGRSFPILKPADVMATVRSMGRAGAKNLSPSGLKANIIKIAKRKGWTKYLPKSWQAGESKESRRGVPSEKPGLRLVESAATLETIRLREARADYEIKLIAPGKGATAFYPKEVLQRDGPRVFKAGTHVYLNHPTLAEEAARPEGDVKNLAGVLTTDAVYSESHAKGEGLFARMKVFADHAQTVEEKAAHVGMSIRAHGIQESGKVRDGVPVLGQLTSAESVDVVTRAGAGGMILQEAATGAAHVQNSGEVDMTEAEVKKLLVDEIAKATSPLKERALRGDAIVAAGNILAEVSLTEAQKQYVVGRVIASDLPLKDGALDAKKFGELVMAEARAYGATLGNGARVTGLGSPIEISEAGAATDDDDDDDETDTAAKKFAANMKKKRAAAKESLVDREHADAVRLFESLGMNEDQATAAAIGRAA
jgi:hypothetical protein